MNKYESVIIVKPNLSKGKFDEISANIKNKISSYAMNIQMDDLGEKTLAYEIRKNKKGHYLIFQYELEDNKKEKALQDIEYFYRITDEVIKYITVKC